MAVQYGTKPFQEALEFFRGKLNLPTATWTDLWEGMHARAFVVAGAMRDDLLTDLRQAVDKAIARGTTLAEFRKDFDAIVGRHGWGYNGGRNWRTRVIYETNLRTAYQAGRYRQMKAIAHRRPFWQYVHSPFVQDPRPEHLAWNGLILRHDDPWWDTHYPPNGWGCRCSVRTLAGRDLEKLGRTGTDQAPPIEWEERVVGIRGPNPRAVKVPRGIDPGWGYNVGKAAWGEEPARRLVTEWDDGKNWEIITPGDWQSSGRPERLAAVPLPVPLGKRAASTEEAVRMIRGIIGGEVADYELDLGGFRYPVRIHARVLGEHIPLDRTPFLPVIPHLIAEPQEAWLTFQRHRKSGRIALRLRVIRVFKDRKGKGYLLVLDVQKGRLLGWSFMPYELRKLRKIRQGELLYAADEGNP